MHFIEGTGSGLHFAAHRDSPASKHWIKCYTEKDILAMFFWKSFYNIDKFVYCSYFYRIHFFLSKAL